MAKSVFSGDRSLGLDRIAPERSGAFPVFRMYRIAPSEPFPLLVGLAGEGSP
jgi:hypothetical protein